MLMPVTVQVQGIPQPEISGYLLLGREYRNHLGAIHLVQEGGEPFFQGFSVFFRKGFRQFILDFLHPGFSVTEFPYGRSDRVKIDTVSSNWKTVEILLPIRPFPRQGRSTVTRPVPFSRHSRFFITTESLEIGWFFIGQSTGSCPSGAHSGCGVL